MLTSLGTSLERLLLCDRHYDIMRVDLIDLMEHTAMVFKAVCVENLNTESALGDQSYIHVTSACLASTSMTACLISLTVESKFPQNSLFIFSNMIFFVLHISVGFSPRLCISVFHLGALEVKVRQWGELNVSDVLALFSLC